MPEEDNKISVHSLWGVFTKEDTEIFLNVIKIALYLAMAIGAIWSLLYYGFIAKVLPDIDAANLTVYLLSIFGVGLLLVVGFVLLFLLPGLTIWGNWHQRVINNDIKFWEDPIFYFYILLDIILTLFLLSYEIGLCVALILFVTTVLIGIFIWSTREKLMRNCDKIKDIWPSIILSCFFFLFVPLIVAIKVAGAFEVNRYLAIGVFFIIFAITAILNEQIARKGHTLFKVAINPLLNGFIGFLMIFFLLVLLLGYNSEVNPFLIAPYRNLKIGQIDANITVDKKFADVLKEAGIKSDQSCVNFKFKVLSSIGKEYIVQASDNPKNIFRIPKDKIILVKYDER